MINLAEVLNQYKRQNRITNDYIAEQCGVSKSTVSRWCNGKILRIAPPTLEKLSRMMGLNLEDMTKISSYALERPILGNVKAGYGLLAEENIDGYVEVSQKDYDRGDYFLRVEGDSMEGANIHNGDLLFVKSCTDVPSGSIAVLLIGGEEVTVKKLIKKENYWVLQAANPYIEPRVYTLEQVATTPVQIVGKALYSRTDL